MKYTYRTTFKIRFLCGPWASDRRIKDHVFSPGRVSRTADRRLYFAHVLPSFMPLNIRSRPPL